MKKICLIIIFCLFTLCACGEVNDKEVDAWNESVDAKHNFNELFDENGNSKEKIILSYGFLNGESLILDNKSNTVNTRMFFETGKYELEIGLLIFVDGIIQPVKVDSDEENIFNIIKVDEKAEVDLSFKLVSGKKGENVRIDTVSVLNPNFKVTGNTKQFGLCFSTLSPLAYYTKCELDAGNVKGTNVYENIEISNEMRSKYFIQMSEGTVVNNLKTSMGIEYLQDGKIVDRLKCSDDTLKFDINVAGGIWDEYNIYVFLNNQLLNCFENCYFNKISTSQEMATNISINADIATVMSDDYSQMFVMAVPVGEIKDEDVCVYKLSNIVVEK